MNSKKAKRIRQLVRHLMEKGAVDDAEWTIAGHIEHRKTSPSSIVGSDDGAISRVPQFVRQRVLDPTCGRTIYKKMKKSNSANHGKAHG
jgi:hypothetical protein